MSNQQIVGKTAKHMEKLFIDDPTGHDWWHLYRVWQIAKRIAKEEKAADSFVVELAALLHDIADFKFHGGDTEAGPKAARAWLKSLKVDDKVITHVEDILRNVSFKGAGVKSQLGTIEGKIVYDADKLDAMGALGIARVFAYVGATGRPIHTPDEVISYHTTKDSYVKGRGSAIGHFHEKLLLLKDLMHTKTGKAMARHRHDYLVSFLDEFHAEWQGDI